MPANKKYLSSNGQRFLKVTAGILGGLIITILFHNALAIIIEDKNWLIITSSYSSFIIWVFMLVLAFMIENGWKTWGIYLALILLLSIVIYLNK